MLYVGRMVANVTLTHYGDAVCEKFRGDSNKCNYSAQGEQVISIL